MKKINTLILFLSLSLFIPVSCSNEDGNNDEEIKEIPEKLNNEIKITKKQFETSEMKLGSAETYTFENNISVSGFITVSPQGKAKINTPIAGIIRSNPLSSGQYVKKGQIMFAIESNEIIQVQQEYAESIGLLSAVESEYFRQKKLFEEKITSEKDFLNTESNYKSLKAKCSGLQASLRLLNINPSKTKEGNIVSRIGIYAPISGYITLQKGVLGQYVEPQSSLMEIININKLYLKLFLFEKDIHNLKVGQIIRFYIPNRKNSKYKAELITVGKSVNSETKTIECIAKLNKEDMQYFINDTYVEAVIITDSKESNALPNNAIVNSMNDNFILVKIKENDKDYIFQKQKINIGAKTAEFTEVLTNIENMEILIEGAYNIIVE